MSRRGRGAADSDGPELVGRLLDVPRETLERLGFYLERLRAWNGTVNLVAAGTLEDAWRRHILDSAQLIRFVPPTARRIVDFGSGGGLPGLVLAICTGLETHLIESDRRKAAFLRDTAMRVGAHAIVHARRIEEVEPLVADVITARALAPLPKLLALAGRFATTTTRFLLLEGRTAEVDLNAARTHWTMNAALEPSLTSADGRILVLDEVRHAGITA